MMAVYTTVYPAGAPYWGPFFASVRGQEDRDFTLWIGLDGVGRDRIEPLAGDLVHEVLPMPPGLTPAAIRAAAIARLAAECDTVIFADSDDIMRPQRVGAARAGAAAGEVHFCAMELMDAAGAGLGPSPILRAPAGDVGDWLPQANLIGLGNSAFRARELAACLPVPADLTAVDWHLATRAWLRGARFAYDDRPLVRYRRHGANSGQLGVPPTREAALAATAVVARHYRATTPPPAGALAVRVAQLARCAERFHRFQKTVAGDPEFLDAYLEALAGIPLRGLWWEAVAHPALARMWA